MELEKAKLTVNPGKCKIARREVEYLGFNVGDGTITQKEEKIDKVAQWPQPRDKKELQRFLGLASYYHQFIPNFASLAAPLTDMIKKKAAHVLQWDEVSLSALDQLKRVLCNYPVRFAPDFLKPFILQTDASDRGLGAVLTQEVE